MFDYPLMSMAGPGERDTEPLVPLDGIPGVTCLHAYWNDGWADALPIMYVRTGVAALLQSVAAALPNGYGLGVWDAWRPLTLQQALFDKFAEDIPEGMISPPSTDPLSPPPHLTGGTVDVTLTLDEKPLDLGTGFDAFTSEAYTDAWETQNGGIRDHRRVLFWGMREAGFVAHRQEWWHYEVGTTRWAQITGETPWYGPASLSVVPAL